MFNWYLAQFADVFRVCLLLGDKGSIWVSIQVATEQIDTTEEVLRSEAIATVTWLDKEISFWS